MAMHLKLADAGPGGTPDFMALISSDGVPLLVGAVPLRARDAAGDPGAARAGGRPARPRDVPPPGPGRLLRDPVAGPRRGVRDPAHRQPDRDRRIDGPEQLPRLLRVQPLRPGEQADAVLHRVAACCSRWSRWPASSWSAATASCWWPAATPRSGCASSATTRRTSRPSPTCRGVHGRDRAARCSCRSSASSRPNDVGIVPSIGFLIGVAIGGRTTLLGPVLGAIAVAWAGTTLSETFPSGWTYVQGFAVHAGHRLPARRARVAARRVGRAAGTVAQTPRRRAPHRSTRPTSPTPTGGERYERRTTWRSDRPHRRLRRVRRRRRRDLSVLPGDLRFLIGPNGAGKTTLIDAVTGLVPATGSARFGGARAASGRRCTGSPGSASAARSRPRPCSRSSRCCRTSTSRPAAAAAR